MTLLFVIVLMIFTIFVLFCIKAYFLTKEILNLVKEMDYEKWVYLTSPSLPVVGYFIWINPIRFGLFVKAGNYFNNAKLQSHVELYVKNRKAATVCFMVLMAVSVLMLSLALLLR